ncbi:hypothetical protein K8R42_01640 [bacterium]|nr:hypothetical protein [bacterium]
MYAEKYLNSVDWEVYIERGGLIFAPSSAAYIYAELMEKVVGIGFDHQLYYCNNNTCIYYRSVQEMKKALQIFADIVDNDIDRAKSWIGKEKELQEKFKGLDKAKDHKEIFDIYNEIFLYNTVIPYLLLKAEPLMKTNPEQLKADFAKIRETSYYQIILNNYFRPLYFPKVAKALDIDVVEVENLTSLEICNVLEDKKININKQELAKRRNSYYVYWDKDKKDLFFYYGNVEKLEQKDNKNIKELEGTVAYEGKIKGKVKIVNLVEEMDKFEEGDILVSLNLNPALMPIIKKSAAIVSDEGGMICHAAIVSRELGIPCVIGTNVATKVLKDGDLVEVDANNGIIKKLNNK